MKQLPPQWGKKTTYDGQVYYFNKVTDETCWDIEEINPETGELVNIYIITLYYLYHKL